MFSLGRFVFLNLLFFILVRLYGDGRFLVSYELRMGFLFVKMYFQGSYSFISKHPFVFALAVVGLCFVLYIHYW